jgi:MFS family permease
MENAKKNVALLAGCQAMLFVNNVTLFSIAALAGYYLADNKALATLPSTAYVVGAALNMLPASFFMKRFGRQAGFQFGTSMGIVGAVLACVAMWLHSFWLLCFAILVLGAYNAFGQYYRFAAADTASHEFKATAISLVMASSIVGGIVGPELSKYSKDLFPVPFLGAYASLILFCCVTLVLLSFIRIPPASEAERKEAARPLAAVMAQPAFIVAVMGSAIGYGIMSLLMTATPLAMSFCGHPYNSAAFIIQWHVIGMFAPSFFTGSLIKRFGVLNIMFCGMLLEGASVAVALSGLQVAHFWWALTLLGVGWNFLYIGGTALLTECYRPSEKAKAQGMHDFLVFVVTATSSFSSGLLINRSGWDMLNYAALPFLALIGAAIIWLTLQRRRAVAA